MAPFDAPVAKKVSEVAKDGEDAITHVGKHSHKQRSLLKRFHKGLLVQARVVCDMLVLGDIKKGVLVVCTCYNYN